MKTLLKTLFILAAVTIPFTGISAQELPIEIEETIRTEIISANKAERDAFMQGDCEKVGSFFEPDASFEVNGIKSESVNFILDICEEIPRPFEAREFKNVDIFVYSETSAHQIEYSQSEATESSEFQGDLALRVWSKKPEGWKIIHLYSTVDYD